MTQQLLTVVKNSGSSEFMKAIGHSQNDSAPSNHAQQSHDGGEIPGAEGHPAFTLSQQKPAPFPILIAVPHAGRHYPPALTQRMRAPRESSLRLEDRMIDLVGRAVAQETGASLLVAHAPRAMVDLNRAVDDMDWDMVAEGAPASAIRHAAGRRARSGLGLVPRRLPGMGELWRRRLTRDELNARIGQVHRPYHAAVAQTLEALRDRWGAALLLDLHSMPPLGSKSGRNPAVDFVLGDRFGASCDPTLVRTALNHFDRAGRLAAHNRPYAGGYVLDRHGAPTRGLNAMQIEVCRTVYLDKALREPGVGLSETTQMIASLVRRLADELASRQNALPQAAE